MSGYNEDAYRLARDSAITLKCPFERALLSQCVGCAMASKLLLAEREVITCSDADANTRCLVFYRALHENARFALHMDSDRPWPFGKEIRAQCGGVRGLQVALELKENAEVDISALVADGLRRYAAIEAFPYSAIMRGVVHYEPRRRH